MTEIIVGLTNDLANVLIKWNTVANVDTVLEFAKDILNAVAAVLSSVQ